MLVNQIRIFGDAIRFAPDIRSRFIASAKLIHHPDKFDTAKYSNIVFDDDMISEVNELASLDVIFGNEIEKQFLLDWVDNYRDNDDISDLVMGSTLASWRIKYGTQINLKTKSNIPKGEYIFQVGLLKLFEYGAYSSYPVWIEDGQFCVDARSIYPNTIRDFSPLYVLDMTDDVFRMHLFVNTQGHIESDPPADVNDYELGDFERDWEL
jgi:hypothetical protein